MRSSESENDNQAQTNDLSSASCGCNIPMSGYAKPITQASPQSPQICGPPEDWDKPLGSSYEQLISYIQPIGSSIGSVVSPSVEGLVNMVDVSSPPTITTGSDVIPRGVGGPLTAFGDLQANTVGDVTMVDLQPPPRKAAEHHQTSLPGPQMAPRGTFVPARPTSHQPKPVVQALEKPCAQPTASIRLTQNRTIGQIYRLIYDRFEQCGLFDIETPSLPRMRLTDDWTSDYVPSLAELLSGSEWPLVDHVNRVFLMLTPSDKNNRMTQNFVTHMFRRSFCECMQKKLGMRIQSALVDAVNEAVFEFAAELHEAYHSRFMAGDITLFEVAIHARLLWVQRLAPLDQSLADRVVSIQLVHRMVKCGPERQSQCRQSIQATDIGANLLRVQGYIERQPSSSFLVLNSRRAVSIAFMWAFLLDDDLYTGNQMMRSCMPLDPKQIPTNRSQVEGDGEVISVSMRLPPQLAHELMTTVVLEFAKVCQRSSKANPTQVVKLKSMTSSVKLNKQLIGIYLNHHRREKGLEEVDTCTSSWYTPEVRNQSTKLLNVVRKYDWAQIDATGVPRLADLPRQTISGAVFRAGVEAFKLPVPAARVIQRALLDARLLNPADVLMGQ
ncbi:hypothetical protein J8273_2309 [Carpediemonas membranifera]|uniref:Uncharacterized protein n=1 Tax=Carpediemonas membranifera TaxID=201153 RepID=A0A8J6AZ90_9EUKA|nr:hypothetical protein J8273_2309 [Carpediemonas membranifera]|eukprot:KAG9395960.1 hypothetical protein J8273_2309 [Carpediemonas membranifera]